MNHQEESQRDELRARFTAWLDTMVYRAKLNYLKKLERQPQIISIEVIQESAFLVGEQEMLKSFGQQKEFSLKRKDCPMHFPSYHLCGKKF